MRSLLASGLFALLLPAAAMARSVAVSLVDSQGLSDFQARHALKAAEGAVGELSGLELKQGAAARRGAPRRGCGEELPAKSATVPSCLAALAVATGAEHSLLLSLRSVNGRFASEGFFVQEGRVHHQRLEEPWDSPDAQVRALVGALLPAWARKGWGGLLLELPPGAQVKVDGKRNSLPVAEPLALTAGVHSVDVVFAGGQAVMQRLHVPEGDRLRLEVSPSAGLEASAPGGGPSSDERLRALSYGLWGAGAAAIAGSLVAGATSRRVAADLNSCQGTSRSCLPYDEAMVKTRQAQAYARTGNILLGAGAVLAAAGVGVFTFDELRARGPK
ncbi:MAG: hypothetical protein ACYC8T_33910 [Myxococcaceae bacterium]